MTMNNHTWTDSTLEAREEMWRTLSEEEKRALRGRYGHDPVRSPVGPTATSSAPVEVPGIARALNFIGWLELFASLAIMLWAASQRDLQWGMVGGGNLVVALILLGLGKVIELLAQMARTPQK